MAYLGMNFGASNCAIAWWHDERVEVIKGTNGLELFPSMVFNHGPSFFCGSSDRDTFADAQRGCVGFSAVKYRTYCEVMRYLGTLYSQSLPLKGEAKWDVTPREAAATIMKSLKLLAENNAFGVSVTQLVLTHPVSFTEAQRADLHKAAEDAGFDEIVLLAEAEAAALACAYKYKVSCTGLIVLNIGVSSTKLCYLRNDNGNFVTDERVPSDEVTDLGGKDFGQCFYDYCNQEAVQHGAPLCTAPFVFNQQGLGKCCEVKERLSGELAVTIGRCAKEKSCDLYLSRDCLESVISEKVQALTDCLSEMVRAIYTADLPLKTVLLLGDSSRMPCIERKCQSVIPNRVKLVSSNRRTTLVALGAALHGAKLSGEFTTSSSLLGRGPRLAGECFSLTLPGDVTMEFVWCPPGTFTMGSPETELGRWHDEVQHEVTLSHGFWMARYTTTQLQYKALVGSDRSDYKDEDCPVTMVSWDDAVAFCEKVNERLGSSLPEGFRCALPTEAQWEYACRAGTTSALNNGRELTSLVDSCPNLDLVAWYNKNSGRRTGVVGQKLPNAWELYDMHGNVWEWCNDWFGAYPTDSVTDPTGPEDGSVRVKRGGDSFYGAWNCRSASRSSSRPCDYDTMCGFRPALVLPTLVALGAAIHGVKLSGEATPASSAQGNGSSSSSRVSPAPGAALSSVSGSAPRRIPSAAGECMSLILPGNVDMEFVWCPPGTFIMGSPEDELGRWDIEVQHLVTLTKGFWMARYPTTQLQYEALIGTNPSYHNGDNLPVEMVSRHSAVAFCEKVNVRLGSVLPEGFRCALPTEAQWEYACRAGTTSALNSGLELTDALHSCPNLDAVAWHKENCGHETHAVGQKPPNAWGLYDMHGNVYEWCRDWYGAYPTGSVTDPVGPVDGSSRVFRGGSWYFNARFCRSACRGGSTPGVYREFVGFRPVLVR